MLHSNLQNIAFFKFPHLDCQFSIDYTINLDHKKSIILLHGYGEYNYNTELHDLFSKEYNVFAVTLRNHGMNIVNKDKIYYPEEDGLDTYFYEVERTLAFIDKMVKDLNPEACENIILYGYGLGGLIATMYCNTNPKKIKLLILNSPYFKTHDDTIIEAIGDKIDIVREAIDPMAKFGCFEFPEFKDNKWEMLDLKYKSFKINPDSCQPWILNKKAVYLTLNNSMEEKQIQIQEGKVKINISTLIFTSWKNLDAIKYSKMIFSECGIITYENEDYDIFASSQRKTYLEKLEKYLNIKETITYIPEGIEIKNNKVYATKNFKSGDFVFKTQLKDIAEELHDIFYFFKDQFGKGYKLSSKYCEIKKDYLMTFPSFITDSSNTINPDDYVDPNITYTEVLEGNMMTAIAMRAIKKGDELFCNYSKLG